MLSKQFKQAIRDYRYLLNREYPQKATIKLVGDKYQLTGAERSVLYRGISDENSAEKRKAKKTIEFDGERILIDTYNILFTLANYYNGRPVFISDDDYLRDAGELKGRFSRKSLLEKTLSLVFDFLIKNQSKEYYFFIDKPVSNSGQLALSVNQFLERNSIRGRAKTYESPDHQIIDAATENDLVCTSDSIIIEKVTAKIFDLSFELLNSKFENKFVRLTDLM